MHFTLPRRPLRLLPPALNLLLVAAAGLCVAFWVWRLWDLGRTPTRPPVLSQDESGAARPGAAPAIAAHLFGPGGGAPVDAKASKLNLRLVGTFAGAAGRPGHALIVTGEGRPAAFARGAEVSAGVTVQEIAPTHVLLNRAGTLERLDLDGKARDPGLIVPTRGRQNLANGSAG